MNGRAGLRGRLLGALTALKGIVDARLGAGRQARRARGQLAIQPFCGFGTSTRVTVPGRVLYPRLLGLVSERDSRWRNFSGAMRRLRSREVANVPVRGDFGGAGAEAVSDVEGYFTLEFKLDAPLPDGWHTAHLGLPGRGASATSPVRVVDDAPVDGAAFGVISDLDDTVVVTGASRLWQMAFTVLLGNARTRLPFPGVSALYRALARGADEGGGHNPVFYVSSSPWNFFDVIWAFLEYRRIPPGPIFLRDWGLHMLGGEHGEHKLAAIGRLFETYPRLSFVLIGDSGEQDPEIYREVARRFPGRVLAVYIREVTGARRREAVFKLRAELRAQGVDLILSPDTLSAAHHALALGLIPARALREVGEAAGR